MFSGIGPYGLMAIAWVVMIAWVIFIITMNRKHHPKALFYLFMVEMWERFSYYGMRAILVLYAISSISESGLKAGLGLTEEEAYGMYAAYGALVYLTPLLGGYLADKVIGFRKAIVWGGLLMALGQISLMITDNTTFLIGLSLLVLGNGFFKPNISSLIGKLYPEDSKYRDSGFTIFYMGINVGAVLTGLTCGTIGEMEGWRYGFGLAGAGMIIGLIVFFIAQSRGVLEDKGLTPEGANSNSFLYTCIGTLLLVPIAYFLINKNDLMDYVLTVAGLVTIFGLLGASFRYDKVQKQRLWVIIILLLFTSMFWTFFELAGSALTVFTLKNVDKTFLGVTLTASNFQSFNPFFIIVLAPLFSMLWNKLAGTRLDPPAGIKFGIGLLLLGISFLGLQLGRSFAVNGMIPAIFIIVMYLLQSIGELTLSPTGLSLVTKLSPAKLVGFMMGFWFLSSSIAHQAGKHIAKLTAVDENISVEQTLDISLNVFNGVGLTALAGGVFILIISPIITKWMNGVR